MVGIIAAPFPTNGVEKTPITNLDTWESTSASISTIYLNGTLFAEKDT